MGSIERYRPLVVPPSDRPARARGDTQLDPAFTPAYVLGGNVFYEVPSLLGGNVDRAEEMFRKALTLDGQLTAAHVGLAKTLIKKRQLAEARSELQAVLDEQHPRSPAEWTLHDAPEARELLRSIDTRR